MRLYCLPHAGGSANIYRGWTRHLDRSIEIEPIELSGRGRRISSPLRYRFREVLDDVIAQLTRDPIPTEYAILGHSFGAILAYEAVHELAARDQVPPRHIFISASCAPGRVGELTVPLAEDNRVLLASLAHLGGTSHEILADAEAVEFFAPILRADLKALFDYRHTRTNRLACDLSVILASTDTVATPHDADLWAETTDGSTSTHIIEGGHFAALENPATVAPWLNWTLRRPNLGSSWHLAGGESVAP